MGQILLYAGGGLLTLHGLLHVSMVKVGLDSLKPEGAVKDALTSHWIGYGLFEALLGALVLLSVNLGGMEQTLTIAVVSAATAQCFIFAALHFVIFRGTTEMPEKIMHFIYLLLGVVLLAGATM